MVLLHFLNELRAAGLRMSTSESMDALQSVASIELERELVREALAASVIKDEVDRPLFENIFARFFAAPHRRLKGKQAANSGEGIGPRSQTQDDSARSAHHNQPRSQSHPAALRSSSQQDKTQGQEQFFDSPKGKPIEARSSDQDNEVHGAQFAQYKALHKALLDKPFHMFDSRDVGATTVLVWLNPEPLERWDTGDSVMRKYTPVCDIVLACRNLEELLHALKQNL